MNQSQALQRIGVSCLTASLLLPLVQSAALGADTEITGVKLNNIPTGVQVVFNIQGNLRPPVFTVNRGNTSIADISNSQLRLPQGGAFRQDNPAPGITSLEVVQLDAKTIRITVNGVASAPSSQVVRQPDGSGLLLNFITAKQPAGPASPPISGQPPNTFPGPNPVPPLQARAVAPPVGDIVIAPVLSDPDVIDLGTSERIPRLLLREAPVREVLGLLARAAGANIAYSEASGGPGAGPQTISLDIENESVQDVFNYVIRVAGLQANRQGRTIFVGSQLPPEAQNRIVRTIRLNQMRATNQSQTVQTLTSQANTGGSVGSIAGSAGAGAAGTTTPVQTSINRQTQVTDNINQMGALELLQSYGANQGAATPQGSQVQSTLLAGLSVIADARTNSITLIGTPRKVEMAMSIVSQLDVRKRQAMVNVKFVDVNLLKGRQFNTSWQTNFGDSLTAAIFDPNGLSITSGTQAPGQSPPVVIPPDRENTTAIIFPPIAIPGLPVGQTVSNFFANIITQVQTGNAVILTNPTLVIQEGSAAQVNLTQEVFSGITSTASTTGTGSGAAVAATSITPIIRQAGVIFNVTIDQIDDNGFITMQLSPEVSAPSGTYSVVFPGVSLPSTGTLLSQRRMESGRIRLRDGQTLVLAGIIQDQDRSTVTKVPILGDIPILGRLFRVETSARDRRELVVMVTPRVMDDSQNVTNGYIYSPGQAINPQMQQQILTPPRRY